MSIKGAEWISSLNTIKNTVMGIATDVTAIKADYARRSDLSTLALQSDLIAVRNRLEAVTTATHCNVDLASVDNAFTSLTALINGIFDNLEALISGISDVIVALLGQLPQGSNIWAKLLEIKSAIEVIDAAINDTRNKVVDVKDTVLQTEQDLIVYLDTIQGTANDAVNKANAIRDDIAYMLVFVVRIDGNTQLIEQRVSELPAEFIDLRNRIDLLDGSFQSRLSDAKNQIIFGIESAITHAKNEILAELRREDGPSWGSLIEAWINGIRDVLVTAINGLRDLILSRLGSLPDSKDFAAILADILALLKNDDKPILGAINSFRNRAMEAIGEVDTRTELISTQITQVSDQAREIFRRLGPNLDQEILGYVRSLADIYRLLGGSRWEENKQNLFDLLGGEDFPATLPSSLLSYSDGAVQEVPSISNLITWQIEQFDALIGQFPIQVEIVDTDPLREGNQTRRIELANLSEALAEIYGLAITSSTNSDISINFLARLASEAIAIKNAGIVTQDYVRANAQFLGYRGNFTPRDVKYAFDVSDLDNLTTVDRLLKESDMKVQGWKNDDSESLMSYLQKLAFAAQIIKAVHFRPAKDATLTNALATAVDGMSPTDNLEQDAEWQEALRIINQSESRFNIAGSNPQPKADPEANQSN